MRRNPYHITIRFDTPEEVIAFRRLLASRNLTLEDLADALEEPEPTSRAAKASESRAKASEPRTKAGAQPKSPKAKSPKAKSPKADENSPLTRGQFSMLRGMTGTKITDHYRDYADAAASVTYGQADQAIQAGQRASGFPYDETAGRYKMPLSRYGVWVDPAKYPKQHAAIMRAVLKELGE